MCEIVVTWKSAIASLLGTIVTSNLPFSIDNSPERVLERLRFQANEWMEELEVAPQDHFAIGIRKSGLQESTPDRT
ncbi:hypothetical protein NMY22_g15869 [Coprinellus aureogranulatus]|nr:hypothetical protein NMY22_g15869 [Coprinellus aureogranulatus]